MVLSRYTAVSAVCALLSNAIVIVCVDRGFSGPVASVFAFVPVLLLGYALHCLFTFGTEPSRVSLARYFLAVSANLPLWICGLYLFYNLLRIPIAIATPTLTLILFAWNFASARWAFLSRFGVRDARP